MADPLRFQTYTAYWEACMVEQGYLERTGERAFRQLREWTADDNRQITRGWLEAHAAERAKAEAHPDAPACTRCGRIVLSDEPHIQVLPASFKGEPATGESTFYCAACATSSGSENA